MGAGLATFLCRPAQWVLGTLAASPCPSSFQESRTTGDLRQQPKRGPPARDKWLMLGAPRGWGCLSQAGERL